MGSLPRLAPLLIALLLTGCGASMPPERQLELTVTASGYDQAALQVEPGAQVFIRLRNRDTIAHNLSVDLPAGTRTVSTDPMVDAVLAFPAPAAGSYRLYCSVPGHTEQAELVVAEGGQ